MACAVCIAFAGMAQDTTGMHKGMRKTTKTHTNVDSARHGGMMNNGMKGSKKPGKMNHTGMTDSTHR